MSSSKTRHDLLLMSGPRFARFGLALLTDWGIIIASLYLARSLDHFVAYAAASVVIATRLHALGVPGQPTKT